ncbi:MAG: cytochrome c, partial [Microvirga sp.]
MRPSLAGALALICLAASTTDASAQAAAKRGEYLATIMACADCHTPGLFLGKPDFARTLGGSEVGFL